MKKLLVIVSLFSMNVLADHHNGCLDFINKKALDGSNEFFQLDEQFNIKDKTKYPVYESGMTTKGLAFFKKETGSFEKIANKNPFYEVVIYKNKEGQISHLTYKNSKIGGVGEVEFKRGANGECYPHQRTQLNKGQSQSFNTELCRKLQDFWAKHEEYKICTQTTAGVELQKTLEAYNQDKGCEFCGVGEWSSSSVKTVQNSPFVKSVSIMSSCDAQGVGQFVNNNGLWISNNSESADEKNNKANKE